MYFPPISTLKIFGCYCPRLCLWRSLQDFERCRCKIVLAKMYLFVVRDRFAAANMHFAATGVLSQRALCSDRCIFSTCTLQRQVYFLNVHFAATGVLSQRALCSDRCTFSTCTLQRQVHFLDVHFAATGVLSQHALCSDRCTSAAATTKGSFQFSPVPGPIGSSGRYEGRLNTFSSLFSRRPS